MCIFTDHVPHCLVSIKITFHKTRITPVKALVVFALDPILTYMYIAKTIITYQLTSKYLHVLVLG